jgi:hypothetical protein
MTKKKKKKVLGSIFLRAWGRGKVTHLVTVVVALSLALISPALAATGGNFILGKGNVATGITQLKANIANPAMKLINNSTSTGATALNLVTAATKPPMTVNSSTKVDNLNADKVDSNDSTALLPGGDLPSGRTVRGMYSIWGSASASGQLSAGDSISFGYRLASDPNVQFVRLDGASTTECPGTESSPEAANGYLCIYETHLSNMSTDSPQVWLGTRTGAALYSYSSTSGEYWAYGKWAVTGN